MAKRLWREHNRQEAERIIGTLIDARKKTGWEFGLQNQVRFRALSALAENPLSSGHAMKILTEMKDAGEQGIEDFERRSSEKRGEARRSARTWRFSLPLYIEPDNDLRLPLTLTVMGTRYTLRGWRQRQSALERHHLAREVRLRTDRDEKVYEGVCLSFEAHGTDCRDAWRRNEHSFDVFRGILELTLGRGRYSISFKPSPKSVVTHPLWAAAISEDGGFDYILFVVERPSFWKPASMTRLKWRAVSNNAKVLACPPDMGAVMAVVADGLRLYGQAVDESFDHERLLRWWQLAERLTLADRHRGDVETVVERIEGFCSLWRMDVPALHQSLMAVARMRNTIVHTGIHDMVSTDDAHFMQTICETALLWLSVNRKKVKTADLLEHAYRVHSVSDAERALLAEALRIKLPRQGAGCVAGTPDCGKG